MEVSAATTLNGRPEFTTWGRSEMRAGDDLNL